jgi:DNA polymerase III epsilon subunit-like protein
VDTETTGVPEDEHETVMIEFACALYSVERKTTLWQLGSVLDVGITENPCEEINGITTEDLDTAMRVSDFGYVLATMLANTPQRSAVVAHNAEFDKHYVMKSELGNMLTEGPWLDSIEIEYPNQRGSKRLAHLCADHGIFGQQTHRALDDVLLLCSLLVEASRAVAGRRELPHQGPREV